MQQKATNERDGIKCHLLAAIVIATVSVREGDLPGIEPGYPVVGYGYPMGVSAKIIEYLVRASKRSLRINHPLLAGRFAYQPPECLGRPKRLSLAGKNQITAIIGPLQFVQVNAPERFGQRFLPEQILAAGMDPSGPVKG